MKESVKNRRLLLVCFLAYAVSYIGKYSYSTNINNVITHLQISKASAGYVTSVFFFCYGIGQLINGIICERFDSKWTIASALGISGIINFSMLFLSNIVIMVILWGLNGLVLSVLWPHCIKLLATIRDKNYVTKSVTTMSLTVPVGVVCAYAFSALFTYLNVWEITYLFSACLTILIGLLFFFTVNVVEKEEKIGTATERKEAEKLEETVPSKSIYQVFGLLLIPMLFISVAIGMIRDGSSTWMPVILAEVYNMPSYVSILLTVGLPLMGVFSAFFASRLMEKAKNVFLSCLLTGILSLLSVVVLLFAFQVSVVLLVLLFMILSIAAYMLSNIMTAILPLYYKGKIKSGQAAGIINASVYLGSTVSSVFLGDLVDRQGWIAFMLCMLFGTIVVAVMSVVGILLQKKKQEKKEKI